MSRQPVYRITAVAAISATYRSLSRSRDHLSRWADAIERRRSVGFDVEDEEADLALSIVTLARQSADLDRRARIAA